MSSFHSCTLLQTTLVLSLVVSSLKLVCCDFSIFSALMPRLPAFCLTWYGILSYTHHPLYSGTQGMGTYSPARVVHSEWVQHGYAVATQEQRQCACAVLVLAVLLVPRTWCCSVKNEVRIHYADCKEGWLGFISSEIVSANFESIGTVQAVWTFGQ